MGYLKVFNVATKNFSDGMSSDPATARFFGPSIQSSTGFSVTPWTALSSAPVYLAVKAISEDMARLPLNVERRTRSGGWERDTSHPVARLLRRPNRWQNTFDFIAYFVSAKAMRGNAYSAILRDNAGRARALIPTSPDRVQVLLAPSGNLFYNINHPLLKENDEQLMVPADDMLHVKGVSLDGYTGLSPILAGQECIGLAIAAQTHGARTFANNASLAGVLQSPEKLSNEAASRMAQSWRDAYSGAQNAGRVAVLEEGVSFNKIAMTAEENQYLETRKFQVIDIARIFRVPPHKLFDLTDAHYQNAEAMSQDYIDNCLLPIALRIEQEFAYKLLYESEQDIYRLKFDFDEMLRSDMKTRYEAYASAINSGILSVNEVREWEGLEPVDGGDEHRSQAQNVPLNAPNPLIETGQQTISPPQNNTATAEAQDD